MTLDPADIDAIAERVVDTLRREVLPSPVRLVDAATLADLLGVERSWVYAHAEQLHAVRLGGASGRLRFDVDVVRRTLIATPPPAQDRRRPRAKVSRSSDDLLPIDP